MKRMWGNAGIMGVIAAAIIMINGCGSNTHQTENEHTSESDTLYYISENTPHSNTEDHLTEPVIDIDIDIRDVSQLDYNVRNDLGYPRIEQILNSYESTIKRYSDRYGFDWRLILAVMNQESRFQIRAVSHRGAYGLMQIMPRTGRDVSAALGIESVRQPEDNIAGGVYYLWRVKSMFVPPDSSEIHTTATEEDNLKLALAAYNAGRTRVYDAQAMAVYLGLDPYRWDVIRDLLPMLSRRYYTLHQYVWENGRPVGGYFYGWPETINYVESVMGYHQHYTAIFD